MVSGVLFRCLETVSRQRPRRRGVVSHHCGDEAIRASQPAVGQPAAHARACNRAGPLPPAQLGLQVPATQQVVIALVSPADARTRRAAPGAGATPLASCRAGCWVAATVCQWAECILLNRIANPAPVLLPLNRSI